MYCVNCGVKLAHTENACPLCGVVAYHPQIKQESVPPLYPRGRIPQGQASSRRLQVVILILLLIPMLLSLPADLKADGTLDWFGFVAGGLILAYVVLFLPFWFKKPNPVIFVPCSFAAAAGYLYYIDWTTKGHWFFSFGLPVTVGMCVIVSAVTALLRYLKGGRLYIWGGALMALGVFMPVLEALLKSAFGLAFIGWSVYPFVVLCLLGGALIYLAIDASAREMMARKLFF